MNNHYECPCCEEVFDTWDERLDHDCYCELCNPIFDLGDEEDDDE